MIWWVWFHDGFPEEKFSSIKDYESDARAWLKD